jgi:hypothetical protein
VVRTRTKKKKEGIVRLTILTLAVSLAFLGEFSGELSHETLQGRIAKLIPALIIIESNGDDGAIGDNGKAFGCLQIWECVIRDVNFTYDTTYKHKEAFYRYNACEISTLYLTRWGKHFQKTYEQLPSTEQLARIWNGGPFGYKKNATIKYWNKVQQQLTNSYKEIK